MLRIRQLIDDEEAGAALRTGGRNSDAFTRIWARLASAQP
jgi:hypothetical protein